MGNAITSGGNVSFGYGKMQGDANPTWQNESAFWDRIIKIRRSDAERFFPSPRKAMVTGFCNALQRGYISQGKMGKE